MTSHELAVKDQLSTLTQRYKAGGAHPEIEGKEIVDLVLKLDSQFPGDIGIFCAFVLNYVELKPGEAIFLGAGEPHAYISGGMLTFLPSLHTNRTDANVIPDIIECMANSDNVIRAGLTPKLRDIPSLISGLTYAASEPDKHLVHPTPFCPPPFDKCMSMLYNPPVPEFSVVQVKLPPGQIEIHREINGPSVAIVTQGSGTVHWSNDGKKREMMMVGLGDVFFIGAGIELGIAAVFEELAVYRAFVELQPVDFHPLFDPQC